MNKTQRKEAVRALIDRYPHDTFFSTEDSALVNELTGWNFLQYKRVHNAAWPSDPRCLAHSDDGDKWEIWSWNRAITGVAIKQHVTEAFRVAIATQLRHYWRTAPSNCASCGSTEYLSVDHRDPPFSKILGAFTQQFPDLEKSLHNKADGSGWFIEEEELANRWLDFHKECATYQILCRSCNSKKGNRA